MTQDEESIFAEIVHLIPGMDSDELSENIRDMRRLLIFLEGEAIKRGLVVYD